MRPPKLSPGNAVSVAVALCPIRTAFACASGTATFSQTVPSPVTCASRNDLRTGQVPVRLPVEGQGAREKQGGNGDVLRDGETVIFV